jgi:hypothetical protein
VSKKPVPIDLLIAMALLALGGAYGLWLAHTERNAFGGAAGLLALAACVGVARLESWTRWPVCLLAVLLVAGWAVSLWQGITSGYFSLFSWQQILSQLLPGAVLAGMVCISAWRVLRYFRRLKPGHQSV